VVLRVRIARASHAHLACCIACWFCMVLQRVRHGACRVLMYLARRLQVQWAELVSLFESGSVQDHTFVSHPLCHVLSLVPCKYVPSDPRCPLARPDWRAAFAYPRRLPTARPTAARSNRFGIREYRHRAGPR